VLNRLIAWSLAHRGVVLALAALLVVAGVWYVPHAPLEVFPELKAPTVTVLVEAPGYAADEVELAVTFPIETSIHGVPGIRRVRSSSLVGLSIVWAEFDFDADVYRARQVVQERLQQAAGELPPGVDAPLLAPISSIAGEIMLVALTTTGGGVTPLELRRIAEFQLRTRLRAVEGVAHVTAMGGEMPEVQVVVRPDDLQRFGLTLDDVERAASEGDAPAAGGTLDHVGGRELPVRLQTRVRTLEDLASTVVGAWRGTPVPLRRVADVRMGAAPRRGAAATAATDAVVLVVQKNPGINTLALTRRIDAALDDFEKTAPAGVRVEREVFRQADFIEVSIDNVVGNLRDGVLFVVLILVLFLQSLRTTLITLVALPLSIFAALLLLDAWGLTLNVMTLAGIGVAIGALVDDAIVDVENVLRRVRENAARPPEAQKPVVQVIYEASVEVRQSILLATCLIVLVFVPLFFLSGVEGRFFQPLGLAYVVSVGASLVVAMSVTPVLCHLLLAHGKGPVQGEGWLVRHLSRLYAGTLSVCLRFRWGVVALALVLVVGAVLLARTFGSSFLPDFNEGSVTVFLTTPPGTSLPESDRLARHLERRILSFDGVKAVTRRTGRAEDDEHAEPPSASEIDVRLAPGADVADVRARLRRLVDETPGVTAQLGGPISHRLSHILSGTPAAVAIKVFGDDLDTLRVVAKEIEGALAGLPGVKDLVANREVTTETLPVVFDRRRLAHYDLTPEVAARQVETAFRGRAVATLHEGAARYDVVVRLAPEARGDPEAVGRFLLRGRSGAIVPVRAVADLRVERASALITRENVRRKAVVSLNVAEGHNLGDLVAGVRERVDPIVAGHPGTFVEYGGQFEAQEEASRKIALYGGLALVVIAVLLYGAYRSLGPVLLILLNLPLALVGGVVALYLDGSPDPFGNFAALVRGEGYVAPVVSIAALVGFIGLMGVACRNGLLLVDHWIHLVHVEGVPAREAVVRSARERLVPILMTALTSAFALVPIALAKGGIGSELQQPLAVVVLGGLVSSTFLNLIVVPAGLTWLAPPRTENPR
jgi:CzcA family heavy metal efflux pump